LAYGTLRSGCKRRFFVCDKETAQAVSRKQKNVAEQNTTKGASLTGVLRSPSRFSGEAFTVLLGEVPVAFIVSIFY
jgi:hypothetical protein